MTRFFLRDQHKVVGLFLCLLALANGVPTASADTIRDTFTNYLLKRERDMHDDPTNKIDQRDIALHAYVIKVVLEDTINAMSRAISGPHFFPKLNETSTIGHLDCDIDYKCTCHTPYKYLLVPISNDSFLNEPNFGLKTLGNGITDGHINTQKIADAIGSLDDTPLYGPYDKENQFENFQMEHRARFVRRLSTDQVTNLGIEFGKLLPQNEVPEQLLVEGSVRVNSKGVPVEPTSRYVRPVAIKTDRALYLALEFIYLGPGLGCALGQVFRGSVFDLSHCGSVECGNQAVTVFASELRKALEKPPLLATPSQEDLPPPGEFWFSRQYQHSEVLGNPYYENSQYLVKWWRSVEGRTVPPEFYIYSKGNIASEGSSIFVNVLETVNVAVGIKGDYKEAPKPQAAEYGEAVKTAVRNAIMSTCALLHGRFQDSVCQP